MSQKIAFYLESLPRPMPCLFTFSMWLENYKITCVAHTCGLHCAPSRQHWSDATPPAPALFRPWGGDSSTIQRVLSVRTGFTTQLQGTQSTGVTHNLQRSLYKQNLPGQSYRCGGGSCSDHFHHSPRDRSSGPIVAAHRSVPSAGTWSPEAGFFFWEAQKANEHHPKQRGRFR